MDLPWGSPESRSFVTNLGLITSSGPHGQNISTLEWTHHISYSPGLIALSIHAVDATYENILATKEFGVSLAAEDQNVIASVAGGSSGKNVDKIKVLKELDVKFTQGKKIKCFLVEGSGLQLECKLLRHEVVGDHVLLIAEVLEKKVDEKKNPLIYHGGKYWKFGEQIHKPVDAVLEKISKLVEKAKKN